MSYAWIKPAMALGVASAIVLSIASAEAKTRKKLVSRASQQTSQSLNAMQPQPYGGTYNRYNLPPGGGINFNDGRLGANYNGGG